MIKKHWYKALAFLLLLFAVLAGFLVPLAPGLTDATSSNINAEKLNKEQAQVTQIVTGYNTHFTQGENIVLYTHQETQRTYLAPKHRVYHDNVIEANIPLLPTDGKSATYDLRIQNEADGVLLLRNALTLVGDVQTTTAEEIDPASLDLQTKKGFMYPNRELVYESIRNQFFHVPMWFAMMAMFLISLVYSILYLRRQKLDDDTRAAQFVNTGVLFGMLGMVTGMFWAYHTWGRAWTGDIKLTTTAILLLEYVAYIVLRGSVKDTRQKAKIAAVYNIFAAFTIYPLLYAVPDMAKSSLHPGTAGQAGFNLYGLDNQMRMVFYPACLGFTLLGYWIAQLQIRLRKVELRRIAAIIN